MPIFADEISFEEMRKLERNHVCAECGALLRLGWSNERKCYILRCERFEEHNGIRRLDRDPEVMVIKNLLKGEPLPMQTTALTKLNPSQMLDRVNQACFPRDLTTEDRKLIAKVSIEYGLDPLFNELMIYQGRPYVTIGARRRKAQETGELDGINARPATTAEKKARGIPPEDYLFVAEVWKKGSMHPFEGWGRVSQEEIEKMVASAKGHNRDSNALPIVKDPAAMAEKRAEAQALRRAFHLPLPSLEEIIEGEFEVLPDEKEAPKSKPKPEKGAVSPPTSRRLDGLTDPQKRKIRADAEKMGYTEAETHAMAKEKFGAASINDLSIPQASMLIDMIAKGERPPEVNTEERSE